MFTEPLRRNELFRLSDVKSQYDHSSFAPVADGTQELMAISLCLWLASQQVGVLQTVGNFLLFSLLAFLNAVKL
jgi:hypothetical protein